jgi:hypothetical protein
MLSEKGRTSGSMALHPRTVMGNDLNSSHLLQASSNPMKMITHLSHLLEPQEIAKLTTELDRNVVALFALGLSHFNFAKKLSSSSEWRQRTSRLYYGVYNVRRAVVLKHDGGFSTDSSDHQKIDQLPAELPNRESHINNLKSLRADRNLADYSHLSTVGDLVINPNDALDFSSKFINDCRDFLSTKGVIV